MPFTYNMDSAGRNPRSPLHVALLSYRRFLGCPQQGCSVLVFKLIVPVPGDGLEQKIAPKPMFCRMDRPRDGGYERLCQELVRTELPGAHSPLRVLVARLGLARTNRKHFVRIMRYHIGRK